MNAINARISKDARRKAGRRSGPVLAIAVSLKALITRQKESTPWLIGEAEYQRQGTMN